MSRKSGISWYASKSGYYTWHKGNRVKLCGPCDDDRPAGPNYRKAQDAFTALTTADNFNPFERNESLSFVIERYLRHLDTIKSPSLPHATCNLGQWSQAIGHLDVSQLDGAVVMKHVNQHPEWQPSTVIAAYARLRACLNWSSKLSFIRSNPLAEWSLPDYIRAAPRGAEFCLPADLAGAVIAQSEGAIGDIVRALSATGARPGEILHADWFNWDSGHKCIHFAPNPPRGYVWKNARKCKKAPAHRYIFLPDDLADIAQNNATRRRPLFPATRGRCLNATLLNKHFVALRQVSEVRELLITHGRREDVIIPYALRHSYITNALKRDISIKKVADMCGTSVKEIEATYSHVLADLPSLRATFLRTQ